MAHRRQPAGLDLSGRLRTLVLTGTALLSAGLVSMGLATAQGLPGSTTAPNPGGLVFGTAQVPQLRPPSLRPSESNPPGLSSVPRQPTAPPQLPSSLPVPAPLLFDGRPDGSSPADAPGPITMAGRGMSGLVGPLAADAAQIRATLGRTVVAGAESFRLDLAGDGLLSIEVTQAVRQTPDGRLVLATNGRMIQIEGDQLILTAAAASELVEGVVRNTGRVSDQSGDVTRETRPTPPQVVPPPRVVTRVAAPRQRAPAPSQAQDRRTRTALGSIQEVEIASIGAQTGVAFFGFQVPDDQIRIPPEFDNGLPPSNGNDLDSETDIPFPINGNIGDQEVITIVVPQILLLPNLIIGEVLFSFWIERRFSDEFALDPEMVNLNLLSDPDVMLPNIGERDY